MRCGRASQAGGRDVKKTIAFMLLSTLLPAGAARATRGPLPFINDDYARARAEATQRKLPMFVDVWAPW